MSTNNTNTIKTMTMLDKLEQKNKKIELLNEMIDIMLGLLNENNICTFCQYQQSGDCNTVYCKDNIFSGIERQAKKKLKDGE